MSRLHVPVRRWSPPHRSVGCSIVDHDEATDPKDRLRALRQALGLTQQDVADRSGGRLDRVEVNKVENGKVGLASFETRRVLADAFGIVLVDDLSDYVDGKLTIEEVKRIIEDDRLGGGTSRRRGSKRLRDRKEWGEALSHAKRMFRALPGDAFDLIGGLVDTLPMRLDALLLGEMARSVWEARLREQDPPDTSVGAPTVATELPSKLSKPP